MIAGASGLQAPRSREIACDHTADRASSRWFEGKYLVSRGQRRLDFSKRRSSASLDNQFFRLIQADAGKARKIENSFRLNRPAERSFRCRSDYFKRKRSRINRLREFHLRLGPQDTSHQNLGISGKGNRPPVTRIRPSSAQA